MRWLMLAAVVSVVGSIAGAADAGAPPPCIAARVFPNATSIPANLPGFAYTARAAKATDVHLLSGPSKIEIPLTLGPVTDGVLKVVPQSALVAGTQYELTYEPFCNRGGAPAKPLAFTATAAAPLPTALGTAGAQPTVTLKDFGTTQYTITATYTLDGAMKPWAAVYDIHLEVDGRAIGTTKTLTNESVQVTAVGWCDEKSAAVQKHPVRLVGTLPFATQVATAATDLDFTCPAPKIGRPPAANPTPGTPLTTTTPDGGTAPAAAAPTTGTGTGSGDSGGCSMQPRGTTGFAGLALVIGMLIAAARRRR